MVADTDIRNLIVDYLKKARLMQLATSKDNQPWVCTVWFAADDDLNIYWISSTKRRHSREIIENQKVSAAIVLADQTPEDKPRGVQVQGIANKLTDHADIEIAMSAYSGRIFSKETLLDLTKNWDHVFYRLTPTQFVLFDAANFPKDARQVYNL
jgi:uncharacterized protein YhbP (UPF0306 family)